MRHLSVNIDHIILGCKRYEAPMQEALYKHYYPTMLGVCMRYMDNRDDAAVLYNEAMLKVLQNITQYTGKGEFAGWVKRIVTNTCIDHCRKNVKYSITQITEQNEENWSVDNTIENDIQAAQVIQWLQQLPKNTSLVFNMYCMEGYPLNEIAEQLNITIGTAKWHISEARKLLRQQLQHLTIAKASNAT